MPKYGMLSPNQISHLSNRLMFILLMTFCGINSAMAEESKKGENPHSEWDVTLGAGVGIAPTYEGSQNYTVFPLPYIQVNWKDTIRLGFQGLNATILKAGTFKAGIGLTFNPGRDEKGSNLFNTSTDDTLRGLGDIDPALGARAFASYQFTPVTLSTSVIKFLGNDNSGLLINAAISRPYPVNEQLILTPSISTTWTDKSYMDTFFGISPRQSLNSQFSQFEAKSGMKDVSVNLQVMFRMNQHWFLFINGQVKQLLSDAEKSPLSKSDTNGSLMTAIGYNF
ncbi:MAG: MltA-interacting MipA family protein [Nitrospirales bacterium]|nr:MAG: MltA-interacting MipA family protein [Nitrospirales bacterium]